MTFTQWANKVRREHPVQFWLGIMMPVNILLIFGGLELIAWAVVRGFLK